MPIPKDATSCATGLDEALYAPLRGVVKRVSRERDLSAVRRDLDDTAAFLRAHTRQDRTDELYRPDKVGRDHHVDLLVAEFLGGSEQAVSGVADDDVDAAELFEGSIDDLADRRRVGDVD